MWLTKVDQTKKYQSMHVNNSKGFQKTHVQEDPYSLKISCPYFHCLPLRQPIALPANRFSVWNCCRVACQAFFFSVLVYANNLFFTRLQFPGHCIVYDSNDGQCYLAELFTRLASEPFILVRARNLCSPSFFFFWVRAAKSIFLQKKGGHQICPQRSILHWW